MIPRAFLLGTVALRHILAVVGTVGADIVPAATVPTDASNGYYDNGSAGSAGGTAVSGLPAPYTATSTGSIHGDREFYLSGVVPNDNTITSWRIQVAFNYGTSNAIWSITYGSNYGVIVTGSGVGSSSTAANYVGDGQASAQATNISIIDMGTYKILQYDVPEPYLLGSTFLSAGVGPASNTTGQSIFLYDISVFPIRNNVSGAALTIAGTAPQATVDAAYSFVPSISGGTTPYTASLTGTLPPGLSFNSTTGAITGTPTQAAVLWTPANLSGNPVVAWWDASVASSFTLSGTQVTSWASKVGGITASQSTVANQPTYSSKARNSLPGVTFNGAQNLIMSSVSTFPTGANPSTLVIVCILNATGSYPSVFNYGAASSQAQRSIMAVSGNASVGISIFNYDQMSNVSWTDDKVIVGDFAAQKSLNLIVDGGTVNSFTGGTMNTSASGSGAIGGQPANSNFFNGIVQEAFIVNRSLTTAERQQVEGYLAWKWAKQANLPTNHPYKQLAPTQ